MSISIGIKVSYDDDISKLRYKIYIVSRLLFLFYIIYNYILRL